MFVPDVAVAGAVFKMLRSATRWAVVAAVAKLLAGLVSSVRLVAATVAVLTIGPVATGLMCTVIVKGWVALGASVPKVQVTVPAVLMNGRADVWTPTTNQNSTASAPPKDNEVPTLDTVRV